MKTKRYETVGDLPEAAFTPSQPVRGLVVNRIRKLGADAPGPAAGASEARAGAADSNLTGALDRSLSVQGSAAAAATRPPPAGRMAPACSRSTDTQSGLCPIYAPERVVRIPYVVVRPTDQAGGGRPIPAGQEVDPRAAQVDEARRFQAVASHSEIFFVEFDEEGSIRYASPNHEALFGYPPASLIGRSCSDFVHPQDLPATDESLRRASSGQSPSLVCRFHDARGRWHWAQGSAYEGSRSDVSRCVLCVFQVITDHRHLEERFRLIACHSRSLVTELDRRGDVIYASPNHRAVLGISAERLVREGITARVHPEDLPGLRALVDGEPGATATARMRHADGSWRSLECAATTYPDGTLRTVIVSHDETERISSERELRESRERLERLANRSLMEREEEHARTVRDIHDELGQGLTGLRLKLAVSGWRSDPAPREEAIHAIDGLIDSVRRIARRLRPPELDELGIAAAVEAQARELAEGTGWQLDLDLCRAPTTLDGERETAVFRVAQQALTNAARHADASRVRVVLRVVDERLQLHLCDDGRGISPQQLTEPESIGMGGMRERASALGGFLVIDSKPGAGTEVRLDVPVGAELDEREGEQACSRRV